MVAFTHGACMFLQSMSHEISTAAIHVVQTSSPLFLYLRGRCSDNEAAVHKFAAEATLYEPLPMEILPADVELTMDRLPVKHKGRATTSNHTLRSLMRGQVPHTLRK